MAEKPTPKEAEVPFQKPDSPHFQIIELAVPKTTKWQSATALEMVKQLTTNFHYLTFRITATDTKTSWSIEVDRHLTQSVTSILYAFYPQAQVEIKDKDFTHFGYRRYDVETVNSLVVPLRYVDEFKTDPMALVVNSMVGLDPNEEIVYELILSPTSQNYSKLTEKFFTPTAWQNYLIHLANQPDQKGRTRQKSEKEKRTERKERDFMDTAFNKVGGTLKEIELAFNVKAKNEDRANHLLVSKTTTSGSGVKKRFNRCE